MHFFSRFGSIICEEIKSGSSIFKHFMKHTTIQELKFINQTTSYNRLSLISTNRWNRSRRKSYFKKLEETYLTTNVLYVSVASIGRMQN